MKAMRLALLILVGSQAGLGLEISQPVWLISPTGKRIISVPDQDGIFQKVKINTSNNNVAIIDYNDRFYFAFRTAAHHHPSPPIWSKQFKKFDFGKTRMYILSAPLADLGADEPRWRFELEVRSALDKELKAGVDAYASSGASAWVERLYGKEIQNDVVKSQGLLDSIFKTYDLREPNFLNINGRLLFYFQQLEGKFMSFKPLRTFAMEVVNAGADKTAWTNPIAILQAGELVWDMKPHFGKYYLTSYKGAHYSGGDQDQTDLFFKESLDGISWAAVRGENKPVFSGGVSEASFDWDETDTLWAMTRNDDGGVQGWGGLLFRQDPGLTDWMGPARSDPRRYDSPRMFAQGGEIYLIARQNLGYKIPGYNPKKNTLLNNIVRTEVETHKGTILDPELNFPFDLAFVNQRGDADYLNGPAVREKNLLDMVAGKKKNKSLNPFELGSFYLYEAEYYFKHPKRTALYWLNRETGEFDLIQTLPSSGDTAFPSLIRVNDHEIWVANYSSRFEHEKWPWVKGQENPTGVYVVKLQF